MNPNLQKVLVFSLVTLFVVTWTSFLQQSGLPSFTHSKANETVISRNPILNHTLGFQEIFVLALPGRADRIVPLLDAANASNISVTILDAVRDKQILNDSYPKTWTWDDHKVGEIGCLVSHLRTWEKIVAERISSAIVMESDADWDLRITEIMTGVGKGVTNIVDWPFNPPNTTVNSLPDPSPVQCSSPYGDKWDIIWMGHCGANSFGDGRIFEVNDTSVPPEEYEYTFASGPTEEQHRHGTRTVFQIRGAVCSTGYAISYRGALKLVNYFKKTNSNIDLALGWFCDHMVDMACVGVWPQVITAAATRSNIEHPGGEVAGSGKHEDASAGPALQYSARVNSQMVLQGAGRDQWKPEWNSTWAMRNGNWSLVSFDEAKIMAEVEEMERLNGTITR